MVECGEGKHRIVTEEFQVGEMKARLALLLNSATYVPMGANALARALNIPSDQTGKLSELISDGIREGKIVREKGGRLRSANPDATHIGTVRVAHRKLFFIPEQTMPGQVSDSALSIPISRHRCMGCLDGDRVRVSIIRRAARGYGHRGNRRGAGENPRLVARVECVLERKRDHWIGVYALERGEHIVMGDGRSAPRLILLNAPPPEETQIGMLVCVEPKSYGAWSMPARGRVTEVLGWPGEVGADEQMIIRRYALRDEFPEDVLAEAHELPQEVIAAELRGREDWTSECVVTIDPEDARDYDDGISVRRRKRGGWELAVHIADVSHYVRPGSALDVEALKRGNSTYLPERVLPMLPKELSDSLCSLVEGKDRLTLLCHMQLDEEANVKETRLRRAVIHSRKRLSYPVVQRLLTAGESVGDEEVDRMLLEAAGLAKIMRRKRVEAGALDLDMPEIHVVTDEAGNPVSVQKSVSDESHNLIEELMLAANEQVALLLRTQNLPALYRVHEEPSEDKWRDFAHLLRDYGISISTIPSRGEVVKAMEALRGHPEEETLKVALLRSMMRACYETRPLGHFGLAKADYCHFTSPIRRYADLVVHRAITAWIENDGRATGPVAVRKLSSIARHLSETERISASAEQEAVRIKILVYLERMANSDEPVELEAIVCAVWSHGAAVDVPELMVRGYIPADFFTEGLRVSPYSRRGRELMPPVGTHLRVVPVGVDWESLEVRFRGA